MKKYLSIIVVSVSLLFAASTLSAKTIQYVSDELTIPMRSGVTTAHKILKFLNSGEALVILEITEDQKHARVSLLSDELKTGWVETSLLMPNKSAREQLVIEKNKNQTVKEKLKELKAQLSESRSQNNKLENIQTQLETKIRSLQNTLATLRRSASDPIRIADENDQLKKQLASAEAKTETLTQENIILGDQNIKSWFLIGAAVSIGSLILGIILTRIRWKKKESWGGNY